jgi:hypothetical protein
MGFNGLTTRKWGIARSGSLWARTFVAMSNSFIAQGQLYNIKKHSTRSKYRGYYIVKLKGSIVNQEIKIAKNLTKSEVMGWVKLLKE